MEFSTRTKSGGPYSEGQIFLSGHLSISSVLLWGCRAWSSVSQAITNTHPHPPVVLICAGSMAATTEIT